MLKQLTITWLFNLGVIVFLVGVVVVWIPTAKADSPALRELRARVEALEAQSVDISVRVFNPTDITIPTAGGPQTKLPFDSERWDTDDIHDTAVMNNKKLTAQTAGKYYIFAHIVWDTNSAGYRSLGILLNGSTVIAEQRGGIADPNVPISMSVGTHYELTVGDYVEVQVSQNSGSPIDIFRVDARSPEFGMVKLP